MSNVIIDKETLKHMLYERLNWWDTGETTYKNVENYFLDLLDNGGFEGVELDVKDFVDNLVVNYDWSRENE